MNYLNRKQYRKFLGQNYFLSEVFVVEELTSLFSLVIKGGGFGGFFASVRETPVQGQQQQGSVVSAEEIERGGAGGGVRLFGGGTKPASSEPSPAKTVPIQRVDAIIIPTTVSILFIFFSLS